MKLGIPFVRSIFFLTGLTLLQGCRQPAGFESITAEELESHVTSLASDEFAGRMTGTPGIEQAELYIAQEFDLYGLEPLPGQEDYFIEFTAYHSGYDRFATRLSATFGDGRTESAELGSDFRPFWFSPAAVTEAEIVFAGYGITAPEFDYDDYEQLDAAGKIVLVLRHEPNEKDSASSFLGKRMSKHAWFVTKAENAARHGAAGMLLFTDPLHHSMSEDLRVSDRYRLDPDSLVSEGRRGDQSSIPALQISQSFAQKIVDPSGHTIRELQLAMDRGEKPKDHVLEGTSVELGVGFSSNVGQVDGRNVVGYLEGVQRDEWVLIGAHHDHIGSFSGAGDTIYNGADDNASGVSAVLELAEAFASRREKPTRSMIFATFSGEELYLLGSRALVQSSVISLDEFEFMMNLDMIGRNPEDDVQVFVDPDATELRASLNTANERVNLSLTVTAPREAPPVSDHSSFAEAGVPYVFFFTGEHEDYHGVGDDADELAYPRMEEIVRLAYETIAGYGRGKEESVTVDSD